MAKKTAESIQYTSEQAAALLGENASRIHYRVRKRGLQATLGPGRGRGSYAISRPALVEHVADEIANLLGGVEPSLRTEAMKALSSRLK